MVCVSVPEDNQGALASRLSFVKTQNHTITCLHLHFVHCDIYDAKI